MVPDAQKAMVKNSLQALKKIQEGVTAIAQGLQPPADFVMPTNVLTQIDMLKKHESVLTMNVKTFRRHAMLTSSSATD